MEVWSCKKNMIRKKIVQKSCLKRAQRKEMSLFLQPFKRNVKGKYFADKEFHIVLVRRNSTQSEVNQSEGPAVLHIHCCSLSNISKHLLQAYFYYPFLQQLVIYQEIWQGRRKGDKLRPDISTSSYRIEMKLRPVIMISGYDFIMLFI